MLTENFGGENEKRFVSFLRSARSGSREKRGILPVYLEIDGLFAASLGGVSPCEYYTNIDAMLKARVAAYDRLYGLAPIFVDFWPCTLVAALGSPVEYHENANPSASPWIESLEDARGLRLPDIERDGIFPWMWEGNRIFADRLGNGYQVRPLAGSIGPVDTAVQLMGAHRFFMSLYDNPDLIDRVLDITVQTVIRFLKFVDREYGPYPYIHIGDDYPAYLSPEQWKRFVIPSVNAVFREFPDKLRGWHCDGDFSLENLCCINELDIDFHYMICPNIDILQYREKVRDDIVLTGNVHPIRFLANGTPESVSEETRRVMAFAEREGNIVIGPGGGCGAGTMPENIDAMLSVVLRESDCCQHRQCGE